MFKRILSKLNEKYYFVILAVICLIALILFFPSLATFYTNDDFFHLKIANANSLREFLNFFNLIKAPDGWGLYRPLMTQVFYFLTVKFFHLNPLPLHIISFLMFFIIIFLVGELTRLLTKNNKIALLSSFLYATSATHFGHLYFLATQELGLTLFFLSSVIFFIKYEIGVKTKNSIKYLIISFLFFILSVASKETVLVLPFVLVLTHFYLKLTKRTKISIKTLIFSLLPYIATLGIYLFLRFRYYGLTTGDSYIWNYSPFRAVNTLGWYGLWSFNLPEMLVDFIGPRLHLNPNLLKYWSKEIIPIFVLFVLQVLILFASLIKFIKENKKANKENWLIVIFSLLWFMTTLVPVLFLPIHKFTFYLTLPLIGITLIVSNLLLTVRTHKVVIVVFACFWLLSSYLTLSLTRSTNWITTGARTAKMVYEYFEKNKDKYLGKTLVFYDTKEDSSLPWSPTQVVKVVLSDNNFFKVFFNGVKNVVYGPNNNLSKDAVLIKSRDFLGY